MAERSLVTVIKFKGLDEYFTAKVTHKAHMESYQKQLLYAKSSPLRRWRMFNENSGCFQATNQIFSHF